MASDYPGSIDSFRPKSNLPGIVFDPAQEPTIFAEDFAALENDVIAVETTLGTNPQGSEVDVAARLTADETLIAGKQAALGFTPEDVANKSTSTALGTSDMLYPSQKAAKTYVDNQILTTQLKTTVNGTDRRTLIVKTGSINLSVAATDADYVNVNTGVANFPNGVLFGGAEMTGVDASWHCILRASGPPANGATNLTFGNLHVQSDANQTIHINWWAVGY